ncbi:MAG: hypothetical protein WCW31_00640 [Patescibacteria group bacterium]
MEPNKVVILPQGPVADHKSRAKCEELLVYCGADVRRVLGQDFGTVEQTITYLSRLNRPDEDEVYLFQSPIIMAMTRTCPLGATLEMRNQICDAFPELNTAPWILYVDFNLDPSFHKTAACFGKFDNELLNDTETDRQVALAALCDVPLWRDGAGKRYLILASGTDDKQRVIDQFGKYSSYIKLETTRSKSSGLSQSFRSIISGRTQRS